MKIAIIVPSHDIVHIDFTVSLTMLMSYSVASGITPMLINPRTSLIQLSRWHGVQQALNQCVDKVLFIDSDQTFPHDALIKLLSHNKKLVGATCRLRREEIEYSARDKKGNRIDFSQRTGLHEVATNGFPFCLIDAEVFRKIDEPWFNVTFDKKKNEWISEDESFCKAAKTAGYKIWVDADLTKEVGHIGTKIYV